MSDIFKIKYNGMKLKVQKLKMFDIICEKTLFESNYTPGLYFKTYCIGDMVKDHPSRNYVKIISKFYK